MSRFYIALFFKFYALAKRTGNKEESEALFTAVCLVSGLLSLNIISIIIYLECLIWHKQAVLTMIYLHILIVLVVGTIVYYFFMYNNRNDILYLKYKQDQLYRSKTGTWVANGYILFTFFLGAGLI
jgi:hypothetical protein